jgi:hypothetical protein
MNNPELVPSLLKLCRVIRRKASEGNASSYIVTEMIPAYRSASLETGTIPLFTQSNDTYLKDRGLSSSPPLAN